MQRIQKIAIGILIAAIVIIIGFWATIGFIATHFIKKVW